MKKAFIITSVALLAAVVIATGCKKEKEEEVINKITIAGNQSANAKFNNVYTAVDGYHIGATPLCSGTMYKTQVMLNFTPQATLVIYFWRPVSNTETIPTGTHILFTGICQEGVTGSFMLSSSKKAFSLMEFSAGTVTVTKEGDIYDVEVSLTIAPASGGGTLRGNFNGELPYVVGK